MNVLEKQNLHKKENPLFPKMTWLHFASYKHTVRDLQSSTKNSFPILDFLSNKIGIPYGLIL